MYAQCAARSSFGRWLTCVGLVVSCTSALEAQTRPAVGSDETAATERDLRTEPASFQLSKVPDLPIAPHTRERGTQRSSILPPLYASFAALQALDAHSTLRAIDRGYAERNPVIAPFAHSPAAMVAMKTATTAGTIYVTERLRRRHPSAAIAVMIGVNAAYAAIVAGNYWRTK